MAYIKGGGDPNHLLKWDDPLQVGRMLQAAGCSGSMGDPVTIGNWTINESMKMWVFPKNRGGPPKWMVKIMENP